MSSTESPLRIAVLGCGRMGRVHAERIAADGRGVVAAGFDVDPAQRAALRSVAPSAETFESLDRLLEVEFLDAAVVATPTSLHFDQVVACRERGLHVLCEKPLADTRERIAALVESSTEGPVLTVGYQRRFWSTYRRVRNEVRSGDWGRVQAVSFLNVENWQQSIAGTWRDDPDVNWGGFVGDRGSHEIDGLSFLTGLRPVEVFARVSNHGSRVPILVSISAVLEGDVPLTMDFVGSGQYRGEDLSIHCEGADWMLRGPVPVGQEVWLGRDESMERVEDSTPGTNPTSGFLDLLLEGGDDPAPASCALPVHDFTAAVLESARTGRSVQVTGSPEGGL